MPVRESSRNMRCASPGLASLTAKYLVVDARTSQAVYTIADHLAHAGPLVQQFERWARQRLAEGFSLGQAVAALATSKRTLARRMHSVLGKSPLAYSRTCGPSAPCTCSR